MAVMLSKNAVANALATGELERNAVMQLVTIKSMKSVSNGVEQERFRLLLSDGANTMQAMAATSLNGAFSANAFPLYSIIRINEAAMNKMGNDKWLLIVLNMEVIATANEQIMTAASTDVKPDIAPGGYGNQPHMQQPMMQQQQQQQYNAPPPPPQLQQQHQQQQQQPQQNPYMQQASHNSTGPIVRSGSGLPGSSIVTPVFTLNPYMHKWTIRVRVTNKSPIKEWNNARGSGKLFSVDLLDEHGGEIRGAFFTAGVDKYYNMLEVSNVYLMSGGRLKMANKQYTSIKHDYEIQFDEKSVITPVLDEGRIKTVQYNLAPGINVLETVAENTAVDVIGVIVRAGEPTPLQSKAGKDLIKRDVYIADNTMTQIQTTFWGQERMDMKFPVGSVLALKGAKLGSYGGRTLSCWSSTVAEIDPQLPQTPQLQAWWSSLGGDVSAIRNLSDQRGGGGAAGENTTPITKIEFRKPVSSIRDETLGHGDKGDFLHVKATVSFLRADADKLWYPACPGMRDGRTCNKKLQNHGEGDWSCATCGPQQPLYRYILNAQLSDASGTSYVSMFDAEGQQMLGTSAKDLQALVAATGAGPEFQAVIKAALFKEYLFTVRVKMENVKDEQRIKGTVVKIRPIEYAKECRSLLDIIKKYPQVA